MPTFLTRFSVPLIPNTLVIESSFSDIGGGGDVIDGRVLDASLGKELEGSGDYGVSGVSFFTFAPGCYRGHSDYSLT